MKTENNKSMESRLEKALKVSRMMLIGTKFEFTEQLKEAFKKDFYNFFEKNPKAVLYNQMFTLNLYQSQKKSPNLIVKSFIEAYLKTMVNANKLNLE